jgi:hypothetical protein
MNSKAGIPLWDAVRSRSISTRRDKIDPRTLQGYLDKGITGGLTFEIRYKGHLKELAEHLQEYVPESDDHYNLVVLSPFDIDFTIPLLTSKEQNFSRTSC